MHVFIDTNILLNFYHFTNDDLDALNSVFVSHDEGAITVHLTDQVRDEFWRNRETKIKDALKRFKSFNLSAQFPYFLKVYEEYSELQALSKEFKSTYLKISKKAEKDIKENNLRADHLISGIFENATILETDEETYNKAKMRMNIGNPPGKNDSIGDAINWILLLNNVPQSEDIYIISEDSDFYSSFDDYEINPFLAKEWKQEKRSEIKCYKNLRDFIKDHYDGVLISFDKEKKELIDALEGSPSFASTHALVAKLSEYKYFSLQEAKAILYAADSNNQFGCIIRDYDVKEFLIEAVLPHKDNLDNDSHKDIVEIFMPEEDDDD